VDNGSGTQSDTAYDLVAGIVGDPSRMKLVPAFDAKLLRNARLEVIWEAINGLWNSGGTFSLIQLTSELDANEMLTVIGGQQAIAELDDASPTDAFWSASRLVNRLRIVAVPRSEARAGTRATAGDCHGREEDAEVGDDESEGHASLLGSGGAETDPSSKMAGRQLDRVEAGARPGWSAEDCARPGWSPTSTSSGHGRPFAFPSLDGPRRPGVERRAPHPGATGRALGPRRAGQLPGVASEEV
jgi:hypothetical protein